MTELRALDIGERKVLVYFMDDRVPWHHRLLMGRINGGRWLVVTPTMELEVSDLDQSEDMVPIERGALMPTRCRPVSSFYPITAEDLAALRWQCKRYADVLGASAEPPPANSDGGWVSADPGHPQFAESVAPALMSGGGRALLRGAIGLVEEDAEAERFTVIERVSPADLDAWLSEIAPGPGATPC